METRSWVAVGVLLLAMLVVERAGADYVWDGEQWQWQDVPAPSEDTEEGSGDVEVVGGDGIRWVTVAIVQAVVQVVVDVGGAESGIAMMKMT